MSIPDDLMVPYFTLLTGVGHREVEAIASRLQRGEYHPAACKRDLAERITGLYYSTEVASAARTHFDRVFRDRDRSVDVSETAIPASSVIEGKVWLPRLLADLKLAGSNGEAKRLIAQGGVRLDDVVMKDANEELEPGALKGVLIQVGKRRFLRIKA